MPRGNPGWVHSSDWHWLLFITTKDQRLVRRVRVKTDDLLEFVFEPGGDGSLNGTGQMRLQVVFVPYRLHTLVRNTQRRRHAARTPALTPRWRLVYGCDGLPDLFDR